MRPLVVLACGLGLLIAGCNRHTNNEAKLPVSTEAEISANTIAQQARIAGAFYDGLVPKLKGCWGRLDGTGEVEFKLTYRRSGDRWEWQQAEAAKSDLSDKTSAAALECMQNAGRGSSFPANSNEALAPQMLFVIRWGWPVPFPEDTSQLATMISTGGGADKECPKTCFDCTTSDVPHTMKCVNVCSGYITCKEDADGNGCKMTPIGGRCLSGWSGGRRGVVIAATEDGIEF